MKTIFMGILFVGLSHTVAAPSHAKTLRFAGRMDARVLGDRTSSMVQMQLRQRGQRLHVELAETGERPWKTVGTVTRATVAPNGDRKLHVDFSGPAYVRALRATAAQSFGNSPLEVTGGSNRAVFTLKKSGTLSYRGTLRIATRATRPLEALEQEAYRGVLPELVMQQRATLAAQ